MEKDIEALKREILSYPEGKILVVNNGKYTKWFQSNGKKSAYIPKKNRELAKQLAFKGYLERLLAKKQTEYKAMRKMIETIYCSPDCDKTDENTDPEEQYLQDILEKLGIGDHEAFSTMNTAIDRYMEKSDRDWISEEYDKNTKYPEGLRHRTIAGISVRSKAEAVICSCLYRAKIAYRYECALCINDITFYPDFTILHPVTGEIIYWEHFGMMDDKTYIRETFSKLQIYAHNGIIPGINLIITFENKENPLSEVTVNDMISLYLQ